MNIPFPRSLALLVLSALSLTSCIQNATSIKLNPDGSGEIVSQYHFSPQVTSMMGMLGGESDVDAAAIFQPDEEALKEDASGYGEGVSYLNHNYEKNAEGWEGYQVTYQFDDINEVSIGANMVPSGMKDFAQQAGQEIPEEEGMTFEYQDQVLTIQTSGADMAGFDQMTKDPQFEEMKKQGMKPSQAFQMMGGMFSGMSTSFVIELNGTLGETNAKHVNGNTITIIEADMGKVFTSPEMGQLLDQAVENPESMTEEELKNAMAEIDGLVLDDQEVITAAFE